MSKPLVLPSYPGDQRDFNRKVAQSVNQSARFILPNGGLVAYQGATAPAGFAVAAAAPVALLPGFIWIVPAPGAA